MVYTTALSGAQRQKSEQGNALAQNIRYTLGLLVKTSSKGHAIKELDVTEPNTPGVWTKKEIFGSIQFSWVVLPNFKDH